MLASWSDAAPLTIRELTGKLRLPGWARPQETAKPPANKPLRNAGYLSNSAGDLQRRCAMLRYLVQKHGSNSATPLWMFRLGNYYADLGFDQGAYQMLSRLALLPGQTRFARG